MIELVDIQEKLLTLPKEIKEVGQELADSKAQTNYLKEFRKIVLSEHQIKSMMRAKKIDIKHSVSKLEMLALQSKEYKQHLVAIRESESKTNRLSAEYEARRAEFEAYRSLLSLKKTEANII